MKSNPKNRLLLAAITLAGFAFAASAVHAATYSWTPLTAGPFNWDNASAQNNWTSGFPNAVGDVATMNVNLSANQTVNLNQAITVGSLTFGDSSGAQTATLATGTAGSLTFDATSGNASLIRTATGTGATTISAPITLKDNLAVSLASGTAASTMNLSGIISESGGAKSLIKDSSTLTLALSGANTFSGGVTILSGTVDSKTSTTTLGSGTLVIGGSGGVNPIFQTGINNANAVQVNANTTGTSIIAANGVGSGFIMSGPITLNSANLNVRTFSAGTGASVSLSGGATGTGNLLINNLSDGTAASGKVTLSGSTINNIGTVTSQGTGPTANVISAVIGANVTNVTQNSATTGLNLTAVNLYTGNTTITAGTLQISSAGSLKSGNYAGAISITAATSTLLYSSSAAQTFSGNITGSGALTKDTGTASTLTLSGTNTYTGPTTVSAGTLAVNGSLANTSTTVGSGGTLQGSGSTGGSVTVQSGGTIAAGNSIESLTTGALSLQAGSIFAYEINNDAAAGVAGDLTAVTGNLTLDLGNAALLTLGELGTGSWSLGDKLSLISYSGTWNGGLFSYSSSTLADDSTISFSGMEWSFNYNDTAAGTNYTSDLTGSSYVTMTAIPEPNAAALVGGLGMLALLRRRRN
ncbi:autotransporter-associated beta strand repeat-containing protein [bacterium]|nr:autotransporter-associated beta strand repeat-containing protein [bacterium]